MAAPMESTRKKNMSTNSLLMSVIRTLTTSDDTEKRAHEKTRLESSYLHYDQMLDKLVGSNYTDLMSMIQAFSGISQRISNSRERISLLKHSLGSCRDLLRCKREELHKLYVDGLEHKNIVALLDQIEAVKDMPDQLHEYLSKKHYLHATKLLVDAVELLEGSLSGVEALRDLKAELNQKRDELGVDLIDELHRQIYIKIPSSAMNNLRYRGRSSSFRDLTRRQCLEPDINSESTTGGVKAERRLSFNRNVNKEAVTSTPMPGGAKHLTQDDEIVENLEADPQENSAHFIAIIIQSLAVLKRIPEAVQQIKERIQKELTLLFHLSTKEILDSNIGHQHSNMSDEFSQRLLVDLLELVFEKFRCVAMAHATVQDSIERVSLKLSLNPENSDDDAIPSYSMSDVWSKIQAVLQTVIATYLDIDNTENMNQHPVARSYSEAADLTIFYSKRKTSKQKKNPLFRFENSSGSLSMNSFIQEQRSELFSADMSTDTPSDIVGEHVEQTVVCQSDVNNITVLYGPLESFCKEINIALSLPHGCQCTLYEFVREYIQKTYLDQIHLQIIDSIKVTNCDNLKVQADTQTWKSAGALKPLLQSAVVVYNCMDQLKNLMSALPPYSEQFVRMLCELIREYHDICNTTYWEIVELNDRRVVSATWAKDDDIRRTMLSLQNWANLQQQHQSNTIKHESRDYDTESLDEFGERNAKESELLTGNIGYYPLQKYDILSDMNSVRTLANIQESLEWLIEKIQVFSQALRVEQRQALTPVKLTLATLGSALNIKGDLNLSETTLNELQQLTFDLQGLSDTLILVLHLEVRVHCFYYIVPLMKQTHYIGAMDNMEPDILIVKLNKALIILEELITNSLRSHKFKYIFDGLGHVISSVLINGVHYIKRINHNGIKKMCRNIFALQQNLSNITMTRESDLDRARHYYELFYLDVEEFLNLLMEKGVHYNELEYMNALQLLDRSQPGVEAELQEKHRRKLKDIIREAKKGKIS